MKKYSMIKHLTAAAVMAFATVATTTVSAQITFVNEAFPSANVSDPSKWESIGGPNGSTPCLTARDGVSGMLALYGGSQLNGCADKAIDGNNFGALRLTKVAANEISLMQYLNPISTVRGLDITFKIAQYGPNGGSGGEGMSFFIKDAANTFNSPLSPSGALGYANTPSKPGVPGALFGIAFDRGGTFATNAFGSANCPAGSAMPNSIGVRGPDTSVGKDGSTGFCFLGGSSSVVDFSGSNRTEATRLVRIAVDSIGTANGTVKIYISGADLVMPSTPTLVAPLPIEYRKTGLVKIGFAAANTVDAGIHEIWDLKVTDTVADDTLRTRYAGNGWISGNQGSRASFGFNYQDGSKGASRGAVIWSLDDRYNFESTSMTCSGNGGTGTCIARGELIQKLGDSWFSLGVQDMTFTFTRSSDKNRSVDSGSFSFSFPNLGLSDSGVLGSGAIKINKM